MKHETRTTRPGLRWETENENYRPRVLGKRTVLFSCHVNVDSCPTALTTPLRSESHSSLSYLILPGQV
jgi:hypothetical protein